LHNFEIESTRPGIRHGNIKAIGNINPEAIWALKSQQQTRFDLQHNRLLSKRISKTIESNIDLVESNLLLCICALDAYDFFIHEKKGTEMHIIYI
jgi:hypothetical protein